MKLIGLGVQQCSHYHCPFLACQRTQCCRLLHDLTQASHIQEIDRKAIETLAPAVITLFEKVPEDIHFLMQLIQERSKTGSTGLLLVGVSVEVGDERIMRRFLLIPFAGVDGAIMTKFYTLVDFAASDDGAGGMKQGKLRPSASGTLGRPVGVVSWAKPAQQAAQGKFRMSPHIRFHLMVLHAR